MDGKGNLTLGGLWISEIALRAIGKFILSWICEDMKKTTTVKVILTQKENGVGMDLQQPSGFSLIDFIQRNKIVYLPVERVGIMRTYELNTQQERIIGERGEYAYSYLALYGQESIPAEEFAYKPEEVGQSLNNQVNYWLEYLMGFNVQTNIVQDVDQVVVTYSNAKEQPILQRKKCRNRSDIYVNFGDCCIGM